MCGIVGIAGALALKDEKTMQRMLLLDVFRGIHSTGLAAVRANGDCLVSKISSHPLDLFELPSFKKALVGSTSQLFLGHNRHATRGEISTFNAHPYEYENIVGVHNGSLEYRCKARLEAELGEKHDVDSQALFAAIDKFGLKDAMSLVETGNSFDSGAWSLVWYDKRNHTLNMLRNKHRPMWYAYEETFKRMFFASRWEEIEAAVGLSETGYDPYFIQDAKNSKGEPVRWKYFTTAEDIHYEWNLQELKEGSKERPKPKATSIKYHESTVYRSPKKDDFVQDDSYPFGRRRNPVGVTIGVPSKTNHSGGRKNGKDKPSVINFLGCPTNPFAGVISAEALEAIIEHGCSFCRRKLDLNKPGLSLNLRTNTILCQSCASFKGDASRTNRVYMPEREFCEIRENLK